MKPPSKALLKIDIFCDLPHYAQVYAILKSIHVIALISWFAGLFYIFRLFVYHVQKREHKETCATFEIMENKLIRIIMSPAMVVTYLTGILMLLTMPEWLKMGWIYVKLLFVVFVTLYHFLAVRTSKRFARKDFFFSEKACRMINEIPTICLIIIVFMVILKPF